MRKIALSILLLFSLSFAQMFQSVPAEKAQLLQQGDAKLYCPNCGMNLVKFYKTSHALSDEHGHTHQYCSLHCLVEANPDADLSSAKVVNVNTLTFIDTRKAYYVVGSQKPGTMSMNSKYAFGTQNDAKAFIIANGGMLRNFKETLHVAKKEMAGDQAMIAKKRTKMAQKGQKMLETLCKGELGSFDNLAKAKSFVVHSGQCGTPNDKQAQAMAIALVNAPTKKHVIEVPRDAKCPVCGMFVAKYPKWAAEMVVSDTQHLYFDGVKDMMKYHFKHPNAKALHVSDYYNLNAIDATKAWYAIGSNVYGPMGNELIPFATQADAQSFKLDHAAKAILAFDKITPKIVEQLDAQ